MKPLHAAVLLLAFSASAQAGQLVYVPAAGVYVDTDTNDVYASGGRNVAIDPETGRTILPGRRLPEIQLEIVPEQRPVQRTAQVRPSAPAPLTCTQEAYQLGRQERAVQYMGNHDPNYASAHYAWQVRSQAHAKRCQ